MAFSLYWRMAYRSLIQNKLRTLLTILGIALGVAVFLAIQLLNQSALSQFQNEVSFLSDGSNLEIVSETGLPFQEAVLSKLTWLWTVESNYTSLVSQTLLVYNPKHPQEKNVLELVGADFIRDNAFKNWEFAPNESPNNFLDLFQPNQILVPEAFAQTHNISRNDTLTLQLSQGQRNVRIAGIYRSLMGQNRDQTFLLGDISVVQDILSMPGKIRSIEIKTPATKQQQIQARIAQQLPPGLVVQSASEQRNQLSKMLAAFHTNLQALSMVSLLVGMFLIYNTMSISILRRRVEIGTLRTLGMTQTMIFRLFLLEAMFIGLMGSVFGIGLGVFIAKLGLSSISQTLQVVYASEPLTALDISFKLILFAGIVGFSASILSASVPIFEATRVSPAIAVRPSEENQRFVGTAKRLSWGGLALLLLAGLFSRIVIAGRIPVCGYTAALCLMLGFSALTPMAILLYARCLKPLFSHLGWWQIHLATGNLQRALTKSSVSVASLMVSLALIVSIATMVDSFRHTVEGWVNETLKANLFIEPASRTVSQKASGLSNKVVEIIRSLPGIEAIDTFTETPLTFRGEATRLGAGNFQVLGQYGQLSFLDGRSLPAVIRSMGKYPNQALVSESFATRFHFNTGDVVTLPSPNGAFHIRIAGVYYDYASELGYIVIPRDIYQHYYDDDTVTNMAVYTRPGENLGQLRQAILNTVGIQTPLTIRTDSQLRQEVLQIFDNTFAITRVLLIVSILIATLSVAITLFTMVLEFQADFTLLRFIGASQKDIETIVLGQAVGIGFLGAMLGTTNGYFLSLLLVYVINKQSFGWTIFLAWPWLFMIVLIFTTILGAALAGFFPGWMQATRLKPEALRYG